MYMSHIYIIYRLDPWPGALRAPFFLHPWRPPLPTYALFPKSTGQSDLAGYLAKPQAAPQGCLGVPGLAGNPGVLRKVFLGESLESL